MIFSSSFTTTSFLREDYGLRFHNIIGFFYDATSENIQNSMILKMDYNDVCLDFRFWNYYFCEASLGDQLQLDRLSLFFPVESHLQKHVIRCKKRGATYNYY
jgi:hypothetical protein